MISIAIDGPCGAGKSSIAREIAIKFGFTYVDTGAIYRAIACFMMENEYDINSLRADITNINVNFKNNTTYINNMCVEDRIRTEKISKQASIIAEYQFVREYLAVLQQNMAKKQDVVMEGRDIGTVILPNADIKIFLTASVDNRAMRRFLQNDKQDSLENIKKSIIERDARDIAREISPLVQHKDAVLIDSSDKTKEEVIDIISKIIGKFHRR